MSEILAGFELRTAAEDPSLAERIEALVKSVWPRYVTEGRTPPGYDAQTDWLGIYRRWPHLQFALIAPDSDDLAACGNMLALAWDGPADQLPDRGWTWAMQTAVRDLEAGQPPLTASGLSVTVAPAWRGKHVSRIALQAMARLAHRHHLRRLIVPVRPIWKERYPITPMAEFARWVNEEGLPLDPWLRTHVRLGAQIVAICNHSSFHGGSVAEWEEWGGLPLPASGDYVLPGLLSLLHVDRDADLGVSIEPNVWMEHRLNSA